MNPEPGILTVTLEYAKDLKDKDLFGKQDPYCVVRIGAQTFRTRTAVDGGRNPVWHENFRFNIITENEMSIEIKDEDMVRDEMIGVATASLARAREAGSDRIQVPVLSRKSHKQHGYISIALNWTPNRSIIEQQRAIAYSQRPVLATGCIAPAPMPAYYMSAPPACPAAAAAAAAPAPAGYYPAPPGYYLGTTPPAVYPLPSYAHYPQVTTAPVYRYLQQQPPYVPL